MPPQPMPTRAPDERCYTHEEVEAVCRRFREQLDDLDARRPELSLARQELEKVSSHEADPLAEVEQLLTACCRTMDELRHLLNPIGMPLNLTDDGRICSTVLPEVATFVTDIRGFTELASRITEDWGLDIFDVLSACYFPHLIDVLDSYDCHYLNYTGDGLLVFSPDRRGDGGRLVLPSLDNAVLCALDLTMVTNSIAATWRQLGLTQADGKWHETGLGLTCGFVHLGDPFVPDVALTGRAAEFDERFRSILAEEASHIHPRRDFRGRILAIHAMSPAINRASRLQDADKFAPNHTCMMIASDVARLSPVLRPLFEPVGSMALKGIGQAPVCGLDRYRRHDTPALREECLEYYRQYGSSFPTG